MKYSTLRIEPMFHTVLFHAVCFSVQATLQRYNIFFVQQSDTVRKNTRNLKCNGPMPTDDEDATRFADDLHGRFADDEDTDFVEKPHGQGYNGKGEDVGRRGNDSRNNKDNDYGMLAVLPHETG